MKITSTPEAASIRSRREGALWLWRVHNEVNARLAKVRRNLTQTASSKRWLRRLLMPLCRHPLQSSQQAARCGACSHSQPAGCVWLAPGS